jgi:hypothetical protein
MSYGHCDVSRVASFMSKPFVAIRYIDKTVSRFRPDARVNVLEQQLAVILLPM